MKTFRIIGLAIVAISLCLSACGGGGDEPITPTPTPEVIKSEIIIDSSIITNGLSFTSEKGEQSISFSTNESWTLSVASTTSGATWCTASATSGSKGNATVKFSVTENTDYENRSVSVTIKSGTATKTFTITQKCADALLVTTDKYEIGQEGGTIDIEVKANISYKMEISDEAKEWITESSGRGLTAYKHSLNIAMNEENEKREGEVYFKSGDKVETVKIYQAGGAILLLSENEYQVSDKGDTISVDIKSNIDFGVQMPDVDWIVDEASSRGLSSHTLKYIVTANEEYDSRSASIVFYDKNGDLKDTLKVVQAQKDAIVISQKTYNVEAEGEIIEVKLSANVDFEVSMPNVDWISQTESRSLTEHTLYFKIAENNGNENREAEITFTNNNSQLSETINIYQAYLKQASYIDGIVTIAKAGTMKLLLGDDYLNITSLKVVGSINGDDVYNLRKMEKLTTLDLSEASIVEGGEWYYEYSSSKRYYTSKNVIGDYMFRGCANLQNVVLPNSVTSIGSSAFSGCSSLAFIKIPDSVTSIGTNTFSGCSSLTTITIGKGVTSISDKMFYGCSSLNSIDIPNGITSIGYKAFYECRSLDSVTIGNGVISIGDYAFYYCYSLDSVTIGDSVTSIGDYAFYYCSSLDSINIPESVTSIGNYAFEDCYSLVSLTIGNGVTSMGDYAFYYCSSLASVYITDLSAWCNITFNNSSTPLRYGAKLYVNDKELTELVIPADIKQIKSQAFCGCKSLTKVTMGASVISIDGSAFSSCSSLISVTIGDGVTSIGGSAFYKCSSLTSIDIPNSVTSIGGGAFKACTSLSSIDIPDSVTSLGDDAFYDCTSLVSVMIGDGVTSIGNLAFRNCSSLTSVDIPDNVTSIGEQAFSGCKSLASVTIGDGITSVGYNTFYDCKSLTSVTMGKSVTTIGHYAFRNCNSLAKIYCYATTPPRTDGTPFPKYEDKATLYVPSGCSSSYKSSGWANYFRFIKEMD